MLGLWSSAVSGELRSGRATYSVEDVAEKLDMSAEGVRKAAREGRLPATIVRVGTRRHRYLFDADEIDARVAAEANAGNGRTDRTEILEFRLSMAEGRVRELETRLARAQVVVDQQAAEVGRLRRVIQEFVAGESLVPDLMNDPLDLGTGPG
jgi:hypothetical protein